MAGALGTNRGGHDHAGSHGTIGQAINDNEATGGAIVRIAIQRNGGIQGHLYQADLVQLQAAGRPLLQRVHVNTMHNLRNRTGYVAGRPLDIVFLAWQQGLFGHPHQHGFEAVADQRPIVGMHQHVATGNVDLVFQGQGDGLAWPRLLQLALVGHDRLDLAALARRQGNHFVALVHYTAGQASSKPLRSILLMATITCLMPSS
jgi:hypothetical protein